MTLEMTTTNDAVAILDDGTGEVLDLVSAPLDWLAAFVEQARDRKRELDEMIRLVTDEVCARADRANDTTIQTGRYRVTVDGPGLLPKWDGEVLHGCIAALVESGVLSSLAAADIIHPEVVYKIDTYALRRARKNPRVEEVTNEAITDRVERTRRITRIDL